MTIYGYGKILAVDLSTGRITQSEIAPEFAQKYIGGLGFGSKILYEEVGPDVNPFGPDNLVIFASGPLTATAAPCAGRTEITTKSPLTGSIGTGNTGGLWGAQLKQAGFDVIVVRGAAERPTYLWVDNDMCELRDASHLWGKDTCQTSDILQGELGSSSVPGISVLCIGPAGENLVRYACPVNDYHHVAARAGAGAVMGAKRLKAIAVRGTGRLQMARPEEFSKAAREARECILAAKAAKQMPGAPAETRKAYLERGCLPAKNYQTGVLPRWLETRGVEVARRYAARKDVTCHACPISCFNLVEINEGKYAGLKVNRAFAPGPVTEWGAKCALDNLPAIWKCKQLCHELGMDFVSASGAIAFTMELFQRGILTAKDTGGLELTWGNEEAVVRMLHQIASREAFGDILAEGSVAAAARIGKGSERYVMAIKGMEMMSQDPRSGYRGYVLGTLTNPRGGDNVKTTHCHADRYNPHWWVERFDIFEDVKAKIYSMPPEQVADTWEGKPLMCKWYEDLYSAVNALGLCIFASGHETSLGPTYLSRLFSACTGWDTTPEDIMRSGERIFTLMKSYAVRQGLTRKDDAWPERFYTEPMPEGPARGAVLDRETTERVLDEYYDVRGWDRQSGAPTAERLNQLGLGGVADDLLKMALIRHQG